jgi:gamma-glutamyltranspeptidase
MKYVPRTASRGLFCLLVLLAAGEVFAQRAPIEAEHGMVVSANRLASEVGAER